MRVKILGGQIQLRVHDVERNRGMTTYRSAPPFIGENGESLDLHAYNEHIYARREGFVYSNGAMSVANGDLGNRFMSSVVALKHHEQGHITRQVVGVGMVASAINRSSGTRYGPIGSIEIVVSVDPVPVVDPGRGMIIFSTNRP